MKTNFLLILFVTFISCQKQLEKKAVFNSFGKAKIDMSVLEFNDVFRNENIITEEKIDNYGYGHFKCGSLKINDTIYVRNVHFHFRKNKLACIGSRNNKSFFEYIKSQYGIKSEFDHGTVKIIDINTNDKTIIGAVESYSEFSNVAIYKDGYKPAH